MPFDDQERTEQATPRRREEARKKGQVTRSQDLSSAILILGGLAALTLLGPAWIEKSVGLLREMWVSFPTAALTQEGLVAWVFYSVRVSLMLFLPIVGALAACGVLSAIVQQGFVWTTDPLAPNWERIHPMLGIKRIFSARGLMAFFKTFLKFALVAVVAYFVVVRQMPVILTSMQADFGQVLGLSGDVIVQLILWAGVAIAFLGVADYMFERWDYERSIRMSRQELREEIKQTEGNPMLRARIRTIQRQMARRRMIAQVPKADVILTNPTELAVAILYVQREMAAPRVTAKGAGFLAQKIKEVAQQHGVPILENKPVARALYRSVKLGAYIPSKFYRAVAEILAYVYRLRTKSSHVPVAPGLLRPPMPEADLETAL